ncbi:CHAD domain-containing protein [Rhodococcus opacus]|nr:CHAD domain-containing protein [Rhodococcus opacus]
MEIGNDECGAAEQRVGRGGRFGHADYRSTLRGLQMMGYSRNCRRVAAGKGLDQRRCRRFLLGSHPPARRGGTVESWVRRPPRRAPMTTTQAPAAEERRIRRSREPGEFLRRYLQREIHNLGLADVAVRRDEPEAIHDMRKASRRARSALQAYAPGLGLGLGLAERAQPLVLDLRWLGRRLSEARDVEVQWQRIITRIAESAPLPAQESVYARVNEYFAEQAEVARNSALGALDSERYRALLDSLIGIVDELATRSAPSPSARAPVTDSATGEMTAEDLARTLQQLAAKVSKRVDKVRDSTSRTERDERIHRARKGAKRMRYAMEVVRPLAPKKTQRALDHFNDFQDVLGEFQDSTVARERLLSIITAHDHTAQSSFGLGILYQREQQIGDDQAERLNGQWRAARKAARPLWR